MSFENITEGSKNYIKYILNLNEARNPGITLGINAGNTAYTPTGVNPSTKGRGYGSAGIGMGWGGKDTWKVGKAINADILLGQTDIPGFSKQIPNNTKFISAQAPLNYMTTISQASALADTADSLLPAIAKLNMGANLVGSNMNASGVVKLKGLMGQIQQSLSGSSAMGGPMASGLNKLSADIGTMTNPAMKGKGYNPLFAKFAEYHMNSAAFDPSNPLGAVKDLFAAFGGRAMRRNMANIGTLQTRGAETAMGHPSGYGYF